MGEEIMKFKKIMFVSILLLAILTIGAVSASGENMTSDDLTVTEDMSVESTTDDVKLSVGDNTELSELISNSSSGSIISLEKDYEYSNSSSEGITIDKQLTIEGNGHSIDAKSSSRIFTISGTVTLKNLILKNGQHGDHGAIVAYDETLYCENCTFINCKNTWRMGGGAIYAAYGYVKDSTFINCTSDDSGGAICWQYKNRGEVYNSKFINCSADYGGAAYLGAYYDNNTFVNCKSDYYGGALYWYAYKSTSSYRKDNYLKNSKFVNCSAKRGGALYLREYTYTISDNSFENCHANKGGVIYSTSFGVLKNNNITNCSADIGSLYYMQEEYNEENFIFSSISRFECDIPSAVWSKGKYNVTFKLDKSSNGVVVLTVAGESRNSSVVNGNATIELFNFENIYSDMDLDYKIEYVEDGEIKYSQNSKFNVRTAGPGEYSFDVTCPEEIFHGNMLNANGSVSNHIDGQVLIYLGTSSFPYRERFDVDDKYYVYSYDLNVRKYNLIFKFIPEDSYYESKTFNTTLTVSPFVITLPETVIIGTYNDGKYSFADSKMKIEWDFDVDYYDSFIVYIDGKEYFTGQTTISSLDLSNLTYGQHTYEFKYLGNTYDSVSKSGSFKTGYSAVSPSLDVEWNDKAEVVVYLPDGATGSAIVKIDDDEYPVQVNDSKARVTVSNLLKGTYNIGISYSGDGNFPKITLENMSKLYSFYKIHVPESIKLGEKYALINLTLPKNATGYLTVTYKGNTLREKLVDGYAQIKLSNISSDYSLTYGYDGDDYDVYSSWKRVYISVNTESEITRNITDLGSIEITDLPLDIKGSILAYKTSVSNSNLIANVTPSNGKAIIPLTGLKLGNQKVYLKYSEDDSFSHIVTVHVTPKLTFTGGSVISGVTPLLKVELPKDATGKVYLTYGTGYSFMAGWAGAGEVTINPAFVKGQVVVITPENFTAEKLYFNFYIRDSEYGTWLSEYEDRYIYIFNVTNDVSKVVDTIVIDNITYENETNTTPGSDIPGNVTPGNVTPGSDIPGNVTPGNKTDDIPKAPTVDPKIVASNVNVVYSAGSYYTIKVYGNDGKLANDVTVKITGKISKTLKTSNGIAKFKITQVPGTYKITINALGKKTTKTLTVKHIVTLKTVTLKKSAKKLTLQASLAKVNGKYLKKKTITFKINGKKVATAKTNSKGVAKITIKNPNVVKKLKVGKKVIYHATYLKDTVKKTAKVKK